MTNWHLTLLGGAGLGDGTSSWRLERKTAALLAYLALEGATPRRVLAGLLWPDSGEVQARTNLRKVLLRLKRHPQLLSGSDPLQLAAAVSVDALKLLAASKQPANPDLTLPGELLAGLDYDDCVDIAEWLTVWRERIHGRSVTALERGYAALEAQGRFRDALASARQLVVLEPLSEAYHRSVMRLHFLLGDRAAALDAYHHCREVLQRTLGVEPLPETVSLARQVEELSVPALTTTLRRAATPLILLKPPLVDREEALEKLEDGWSQGKLLLLVGQAGIGKTRLAQEFLGSKGDYHHLGGRPGDATVPYASSTRFLRSLLKEVPRESLASWVRLELARVLPGYFPHPAGGATGMDRQRFFEAHAEVLLRTPSVAGLLIDDLHNFDPASFELILFLLERFAGIGGQLGAVGCFRPADLPEDFRRTLERLQAEGLAALVLLSPLGEAAVRRLLAHLPLPAGSDYRELQQLTGGNPFLLVETFKSLYRSGSSSAAIDTGESVMTQRLARLSPAARHLLWALAIAGGEVDLELAAAMLQLESGRLFTAVTELEETMLLVDDRLAHDLVAEAARAALPESVRRLFHRRAAVFLETREDGSLKAAEHWASLGESDRAIRQWRNAAHELLERGLPDEAVRLLERAREAAGRRPEALELEIQLARHYSEMARYRQARALIDGVLTRELPPELRASALYVHADLLCVDGRLERAADVIEEGSDLAVTLRHEQLQEDFLNMKVFQAFRTGAFEAGLRDSLDLLNRYRRRPPAAGLVTVLSNLGVFCRRLGRLEEALTYLREACYLAEKLNLKQQRFMSTSNLARVYAGLGRLEEALELTDKALAIGHFHGFDTVRGNQASLLMDLGRYPEAIRLSQELAESGEQLHDRIYAYTRLAELHILRGRPDRARQALDVAIELAEATEMIEPRVRIILTADRVGSEEQRRRLRSWLERLDPAGLSRDVRPVLEKLRSERHGADLQSRGGDREGS